MTTAADDMILSAPTCVPPERVQAIVAKCAPYTMTSAERIEQTVWSVAHALSHGVPGDFVEIGVWRGGSVMAMLYALMEAGITDREVHLYDTFEGMTEPADVDIDWKGNRASDVIDSVKCACDLDTVRQNIASTGYPMDRVHFHVGDIRLATTLPDRIAALRIDCDWHDLVLRCLRLFEPLVTERGVITIDDYGYWAGARKAVEEYLAARPPRPDVVRIDDTGVFWLAAART